MVFVTLGCIAVAICSFQSKTVGRVSASEDILQQMKKTEM